MIEPSWKKPLVNRKNFEYREEPFAKCVFWSFQTIKNLLPGENDKFLNQVVLESFISAKLSVGIFVKQFKPLVAEKIKFE